MTYGIGTKGLVNHQELNKIGHTFDRQLPALGLLPESFKASVADIKESALLEMWDLPLGTLQALNGKSIPAYGIQMDKLEKGLVGQRPTTLYIPTSGNTGASFGYIAPLVGAKAVAVIERSVPEGKQIQLRLAGAEIEYTPDGVNAIDHARKLAEQPDSELVNQYEEDGGIKGHEYTMKHIAHTMYGLGISPSVLCAGAGSCTVVCAADRYLKPKFSNLSVVGVGCKDDENVVSGCRTKKKIERDIKFPWEQAVGPDGLVLDVTKHDAFMMSWQLIMSRRPWGPTAGLALCGFLHRFREMHRQGRLGEWINSKGKIVAVFVFMDLFLPYGEDYKKVLAVDLRIGA